MFKIGLKVFLLSVIVFGFYNPILTAQNLKEFYFPLSELEEARIYKYSNIFNTEELSYWHLEKSVENNKVYLTTTVYDENLKLIEIFKEEIITKGSEIANYRLVVNSEEVIANIIRREVFKWDQEIDSSIDWAVSCFNAEREIQLGKTRTLKAYNTTCTFRNREYETVKFRDDFSYRTIKNGREEAYFYYQDSFYSKGIGLTEYIRYFPEGDLIHFKLSAIMSTAEWEGIVGDK